MATFKSDWKLGKSVPSLLGIAPYALKLELHGWKNGRHQYLGACKSQHFMLLINGSLVLAVFFVVRSQRSLRLGGIKNLQYFFPKKLGLSSPSFLPIARQVRQG